MAAKRTFCIAREAGVSGIALDAVVAGLTLLLNLIDSERKTYTVTSRLYTILPDALRACVHNVGIIDGDKLISRMRKETKVVNGLYILVLNQKIIYNSAGEVRYCDGLGGLGSTALIDASELLKEPSSAELYSRILRITVHEIGHVLGLILKNDEETPDKFVLSHCTDNRCIMQSHGSFSTEVDLYNPVCKSCLAHLMRSDR